jgi:hypothetical protein
VGRIADRLFWSEEGQAKTDERFRQARDPQNIEDRWRRFRTRTCCYLLSAVSVAISAGLSHRRGTDVRIGLLALSCVWLALVLIDFGWNYRHRRRGDWPPRRGPSFVPDRLWRLGRTPLTLGIAGRLVAVFVCAGLGALIGEVLASDWRQAPLVLGFSGYAVSLFIGEMVARRLDRAGRLPRWTRLTDVGPINYSADYSLPPPDDGPIFNGRADQAAFRVWLARRRAKSRR